LNSQITMMDIIMKYKLELVVIFMESPFETMIEINE